MKTELLLRLLILWVHNKQQKSLAALFNYAPCYYHYDLIKGWAAFVTRAAEREIQHRYWFFKSEKKRYTQAIWVIKHGSVIWF